MVTFSARYKHFIIKAVKCWFILENGISLLVLVQYPHLLGAYRNHFNIFINIVFISECLQFAYNLYGWIKLELKIRVHDWRTYSSYLLARFIADTDILKKLICWHIEGKTTLFAFAFHVDKTKNNFFTVPFEIFLFCQSS